MNRDNMPAAEVEVDVHLVRSLLQSQRPDLIDLEVSPLAFGWDNVSFRLGGRLVVRLPRREAAAGLVVNEARWLPVLAPRLPLPVPSPVFVGEPGEDYPWSWLIAPYLPGVSAGVSGSIDRARCAEQLGDFLRCLHEPAPRDAPQNPFRGVPLSSRDGVTRERLAAVGDVGDRRALEWSWDVALSAEEFAGPGRWVHGDLHPHNLLVSEGALSGVVDFGDITSGDPAVDLAVAWSFLAPVQGSFWAAYDRADAAMRDRARGWAVALGLAYLANSADNPVMAGIGETTLGAVIDL